MTQEFFKDQIKRLKIRFGEQHYDVEFCKLAFREVETMSESAFKWTVETWLGSRPAHKPPLKVDFTEARLSEERRNLAREAQEASRRVKSSGFGNLGLQMTLARDYPGAKTIVEAIELVKKRKRNSGNDEGPGAA